MTFRKASGNMYDFVSHTFNSIKGECPHNCEYCYMKKFTLNKIRLDKKALKLDLGKDNFIFLGSSCDVFAKGIPKDWVRETLNHCAKFDNKYLFQSKNPKRMYEMLEEVNFPKKMVLGTTIETNRKYKQLGNTPTVKERAEWMNRLKEKGETMITLEPIMDFDLNELVEIIRIAQPDWVNIGADSQEHNLPEPSKEKIQALVLELDKFTEIKKKRNIERLIR